MYITFCSILRYYVIIIITINFTPVPEQYRGSLPLQDRAFALVARSVVRIAVAGVAGLRAAHQLAKHVAHSVVEPANRAVIFRLTLVYVAQRILSGIIAHLLRRALHVTAAPVLANQRRYIFQFLRTCVPSVEETKTV